MKKVGHFGAKLALYVLLISMSVVFLYPFLYMAVTSIQSYNDILNATVKWIPREFSPQNWKYAFDSLNYGTTSSIRCWCRC